MIALLGGTFDPVHCGHIAAALEGKRLLEVECVRLVVARSPWHKPAPGTAAAVHRLGMLTLACNEHAGLIPDDSELGGQGPSYTVELLERRTQQSPTERRCWIIGSDAFALIRSWHRFEDVFRLTNFLVFKRSGAEQEFAAALADFIEPRRVTRIAPDRHGQVVVADANLPAVSSSVIRAAVGAGQSVDAWVTPAVLGYIRNHHLYA